MRSAADGRWRIGDGPEPVISLRENRELNMRVFVAAVMIALMAGSALAQEALPRYGDIDKEKSPSQKEEERNAERAYKKSLRNIPDKAGPSDPWGTVRSDNVPAAATSATQKKSKTGSAAKQSPQ
jgi:hypothetical protein